MVIAVDGKTVRGSKDGGYALAVKENHPRSLDVTFREDYSRVRKDHSSANLSVIRKIVFTLLKMDKMQYHGRQKMSLGRKQKLASYNPEFRVSLLLNL